MIQPYFRNQTLMCTEKVLFEFHYFKVGWPLQSYYTGLFWKLNSHTNISSFNSIYIKLTNFDTWIQQTVVSFSGWFRLLPFSIQSLMILISFYAPWAHAHSLPWSTDQKKKLLDHGKLPVAADLSWKICYSTYPQYNTKGSFHEATQY